MCWKIYKQVMILVFLFSPKVYLSAQQISGAKKLMSQEYNLVPQHSRDTQYYEMESKLEKHALDGTPQGLNVYRVSLV